MKNIIKKLVNTSGYENIGGFINNDDIYKVVDYAKANTTYWEGVKAVQQLTGFFHNKDGYNLKSLLDGMGLDREEWDNIPREVKGGFTEMEISLIESLVN